MFRMYVMDTPTKWEDFFHLVDFSYNNSYNNSIKISYFEALYGIKCHTLLSWSQKEDKLVFGPQELHEMEKTMKII